MPAKMPRAREYVRTSAFIFQSVSAPASRPTGPAAADSSAPNLNLLASRCCMPCSFVTTMTKSIAWPPSCKPQLPPVMVIGAGALHPCSVRQVATPLPWLPPNPTAIFTIDGITAMHFASLITLSGTALSGVAMISSSTLAEASMRLEMSDLSADQPTPLTRRNVAPRNRTCQDDARFSWFIGTNSISGLCASPFLDLITLIPGLNGVYPVWTVNESSNRLISRKVEDISDGRASVIHLRSLATRSPATGTSPFESEKKHYLT